MSMLIIILAIVFGLVIMRNGWKLFKAGQKLRKYESEDWDDLE